MSRLIFRINYRKFFRSKYPRRRVLIAGHHSGSVIGSIFTYKNGCTWHNCSSFIRLYSISYFNTPESKKIIVCIGTNVLYVVEYFSYRTFVRGERWDQDCPYVPMSVLI